MNYRLVVQLIMRRKNATKVFKEKKKTLHFEFCGIGTKNRQQENVQSFRLCCNIKTDTPKNGILKIEKKKKIVSKKNL